MIDITVNELSKIKESNKSVLLIWAEGCEACELSKPFYEEFSNNYTDFDYYKLQFAPEIMDFYISVIPKQPVQLQLKNEDGSLVLDHNGNPIIVQKITENGTLILETPIAFPNFLVFDKTSISDSNPYGFLGHIAGLQKERLEFVLKSLSTQNKEAA